MRARERVAHARKRTRTHARTAAAAFLTHVDEVGGRRVGGAKAEAGDELRVEYETGRGGEVEQTAESRPPRRRRAERARNARSTHTHPRAQHNTLSLSPSRSLLTDGRLRALA